MIKRFFWLVVGGVAAVFGLSFLKKKAEENPEQFSTEALIDKFIEIFDNLKLFIASNWQGFSGGEKLNDDELEKIFETKTLVEPEADSTVKPTD